MVPKANLWIINYCYLEMKVDNEPAISLPVYSKSLEKWKYVLHKNKTKKEQKGQTRGKKSLQRRESNPGPPKCKVNTLSIAPGQLTQTFPAFVTSTSAKTWKWASGGQTSNGADNPSTSSGGGRSKYCCVPGCQSSFYDNQGNKSNISFFYFPLEAKVRNRWLLAIERQEHRDRFVVTE